MKESRGRSGLIGAGVTSWKVTSSRHGWKSGVISTWNTSSPVTVASAVNSWRGSPPRISVLGE